MRNGELWLLDTNILIRWVQPSDSGFALVDAVTRQLQQSHAELCYTSQNLGEFWNVLTGLPIATVTVFRRLKPIAKPLALKLNFVSCLRLR